MYLAFIGATEVHTLGVVVSLRFRLTRFLFMYWICVLYITADDDEE